MSRRTAIRLHRWIGLAIGLLWALQGLTGALLTFKREIDAALNPPLAAAAAGPRLSLDRLAASGAVALGAKPQRLFLADADGRIWDASAGPEGARRSALIEAATGRVLLTRSADPATPERTTLMRWTRLLHEDLLLHDSGATLIAISGLFLAATAALGVWAGWPARWLDVTAAARWRSPRVLAYGWHRLIGFGAALALLPVALTGSTMHWGKDLRAAAAQAGLYRPPAEPRAPGAPRISLDTAALAAVAALPGARATGITLPKPGDALIKVRLRTPGDPRAVIGSSTAAVDGRSGAVLDLYDARRAPPFNRIFDLLYPIHTGELAALPGRVLTAAAGLSLPTLYALGVWHWLSRRSRRRVQNARPNRASPIPEDWQLAQ